MDHKLQAVLHRYLKRQGYSATQLDQWLQYPRSRHNRKGLIRHSPGHHHHLHIRFDCVRSDDPCRRPTAALVPETRSRQRLMAKAKAKSSASAPTATSSALASSPAGSPLEAKKPVPQNTPPAELPTVADRDSIADTDAKTSRHTITETAVLPAPAEGSQRVHSKAVETEVRPSTREQLQALFGAITAPRGGYSHQTIQHRRSHRRSRLRRAIDRPARMTRLGATVL